MSLGTVTAGLVVTAVYLTFEFPSNPIRSNFFTNVQLPKRKPSRRNRLRSEETFSLLWAIKSELEAGATPERALTHGLATLPESKLTATRVAVGSHTELHAALLIDAHDMKADELQQLAEIFEITAYTGAPIESSVTRLIATVRAQQTQNQLIREELASTKTTMYVLAMIPVIGLFIATVAGLNPIAFLVSTPWGWACLLVALTLECVGIGWIRLLVSRATAQ